MGYEIHTVHIYSPDFFTPFGIRSFTLFLI